MAREREPRASPQGCLLGHPGPAEPSPQPKEPAKEKPEEQTCPDEEQQKLVVDADDFAAFTMKVKGHLHGNMTETEHLANFRGSQCFGDPGSQQLVHALCQKGHKGANGPNCPNQDSFSVTHFENGWTLVCVVDGHGQHGHMIASRISWTIPFFLLREFTTLGVEEAQDCQVDNAMTMAFENAHFDVLAYAAEKKINVRLSGTTAAVTLAKGDTVYLANAGDSRAIVGAVHGEPLIAATQDHSPSEEGEKAGSLDLFVWPYREAVKPLLSRQVPVPALRHHLQGPRGILRGRGAHGRVPGWRRRRCPRLHQGQKHSWPGDDQSHRRQNRIALLGCC